MNKYTSLGKTLLMLGLTLSSTAAYADYRTNSNSNSNSNYNNSNYHMEDQDRSRSDYDRSRTDYDRSRTDYDRSRSDYDRPRTDQDRTRSDYDRSRTDQDRTRSDYDRSRSGSDYDRKDKNEYAREFPKDQAMTPSDEELNRKIRDKVSRGWFTTSYKGIALHTNNGVVTLEGSVDNMDDQKKLIQEIQKVDGVRNVVSNLKLNRKE